MNKTNKINQLFFEALKFFGISGIGWIIDFTVFTILTSVFTLDINIANTISSLIGVSFVFIVSTRKIFSNNSKINLYIKYIIYIVYQVTLIILVSHIMLYLKNYLLTLDIKTITNFINIIVKIIITPFTMIINYIFMKCLIEKL